MIWRGVLAAAVWCLCLGTGVARAVTLEEMAGEMLMAGFRGQTLAEAPDLAEDLKAGRAGGVVLFDYDVLLKQAGRNIASPQQLKALTDSLRALRKSPVLVAVDQEGGRVQRLKSRNGFTDFPSAAELGSRNSEPATRAAALDMGRLLRGMGINCNFAPVLDVNVNPANPVVGAIGRSFSADPALVGRQGLAFLDGLREAGVLPCVKHFPGHGSSRDDSHLGLPDVSATWSEPELGPFQQAIAAGCPAVMTAHLFNRHWDPELPATLSPKVLQGILRQRLGFKGVIVSDDMQMAAIAQRHGQREAIKLAVLAGVDILLFGNNLAFDPQLARKMHAMLLDLVKTKEIPESRIRESYARVQQFKALIRP